MKIAIIPTTGGEDPFRGMEIAVKLGVEGVHIPAYSGKLNLAGKTREERVKIKRSNTMHGSLFQNRSQETAKHPQPKVWGESCLVEL